MINDVAIKVAIKIKPTLQGKCIAQSNLKPGSCELVLSLPDSDVQVIQADFIHDCNKTDDNIYATCNITAMLSKFLQGYNVAILAYGQTGSGKTYALEGDSSTKGIIELAIAAIYKNRPCESAVIRCSYIQLYNQKIADMFSQQCGALEKGLKMHWQAELDFVIQDAIEKVCSSPEEMIRQWKNGAKNRVISSNKIHDYSSRSHSIFIVMMQDEDQEHNRRARQIQFVDLAGSQRVLSPIKRLNQESININKSLFFLRKVISTLQQINETRKEIYVPYRDSKLSSLLKKALGGNCLTLIIACINGSEDYYEESLSTLRYAVRASKIKNQVSVNIDARSKEVYQLKRINQKLQMELNTACQQIQFLKSIEKEAELKRKTNNEYAKQIIQCIGTVRDLLQSNKQLRKELQVQKSKSRKLELEIQEMQKEARKTKRVQDSPRDGQLIRGYTNPNPLLGASSFRINPSPVRQNNSTSTEVLSPKYRSVVHRRKYLFHEKTQERV